MGVINHKTCFYTHVFSFLLLAKSIENFEFYNTLVINFNRTINFLKFKCRQWIFFVLLKSIVWQYCCTMGNNNNVVWHVIYIFSFLPKSYGFNFRKQRAIKSSNTFFNVFNNSEHYWGREGAAYSKFCISVWVITDLCINYFHINHFIMKILWTIFNLFVLLFSNRNFYLI